MRCPSSHQQRQRAIALVLTLGILVIATILIVGFVSSMRTERQASASMASNQSAELIAQAALDHAISILDQNIPQPIPPGQSTANPTNWIINPGLLTTVQGAAGITQIPLSSNPSTTYPSTSQDAQLNVPQASGTSYTILDTADPMRVAWIPLVKDPASAASATNRIVGRYAFWIDDESAKLNINTAYGKPASLDFTALTPGTVSISGPHAGTYPLSYPSSVNLDILDSSSYTIDAAGLATAVGDQGGLTNADAIKAHLLKGDSNQFFNANKFFLTAFSRDPEFNVFGKSRLYLFRRLVDSSNGNTLHPLGYPLVQAFRDSEAPMYFHADEGASADTAAPYYTAAGIAGRTVGGNLLPGPLSRADWPGMPPASFVDKWDKDLSGTRYSNIYPGLQIGDMGKREADQVAWDMVVMGSFSDYETTYSNATSGDYVRFENKIAATKPGNPGTVNYPNAAIPIGPLSGLAIVPAFPRPLINEVCLTVFLEPNQVAGVTKFRLKVWLQTELWLGPGYPVCDFSSTAEEVGLTYLDYTVTQDNNAATPVAQKDVKYIKSSDPDGIRSLFGAKTSGALPDSGKPPSRYAVVATQGSAGNPSPTNKWIYVRNGSGFSSSTVGPFNFEPAGMLHLDFKMRLFEHSPTGATATAPACSLVPVWDTHDPGTSFPNSPFGNTGPSSPVVKAFTPPKDDQKDYIEFKFDLDPAALGGQQVTRSLEVADPRLGGLARNWVPVSGFNDATNASADTLGAPNHATTGWDTKKFAFVDFSNPAGGAPSSSYRPPVGMFSFVPTGTQRGIPGVTLKLQPSGSKNDLPDWLLLDLLSPTADARNYSAISLMNSTAGKVNLNAGIYPSNAQFAPPSRWQPLQAVFQNMSAASTVSAGSTTPSAVVDAVLKHTLSTPNGVEFGAANEYDYPGEVCEIAGVADNGASDWDKEAMVRYIASNVTTKSNVFSVWGVAQTVKKNPANNNAGRYGSFETKSGGANADDVITGEKRFQAVVERYVWPGTDAGSGNAHVSVNGSYDQLGGQQQPGQFPPYAGGTWETIDGPDSPTYPIDPASGTWNKNSGNSFVSSTIDNASNPLRAVMKYRVIAFRYLAE